MPLAGADPEMALSQTTQFIDTEVGDIVSAPRAKDLIADSDAMQVAGLTDFLSRPVRILSLAWATSAPSGRIFGQYNPWKLFFSNQYIQYKLNNYAFLRCNLKLKIIVNASPFYYGALRMAYTPMTGMAESGDLGSTSMILMQNSQKPGVWIDPSLSEGCEMTLPFIYHRNFLKISDVTNFEDIGDIRFYNYAPLQSANGVASASVSIQVYAWAEDVQLSGPTLGLALQGDEYGTGPVSGPASAVARIASAAKNVPYIGKFAAATEMGAGAVVRIAKLFGFTNVPVITPAVPMRPSPFPQMASTEIGYPVEKLTIDSKNELSIDPTIVGCEPIDELAISHLVQKPSVIIVSPWATTDNVDTNIVTMRVNPFAFALQTAAGQTRVQMTPTAMVAYLFNHWRGDLIYTFKFVASPFHKGRVRISYDPVDANMQTATDIGSVLQNTIVDLGAEREVEVRVPFQQLTSWLNVTKATTVAPFANGNAGLSVLEGTDNGMLTVKVLTLLTAPVATAPVNIIVSIRGADNLEFGNPSQISTEFTPFNLQGENFEANIGSTKGGDDHLYRVNFGEKISSLRPLLRRSNYVDSLIGVAGVGTFSHIHKWVCPKYAAHPGYDPAALTNAVGLIAPGSTFKFQYTQMTPWHWIVRAFIAQRGAIHWHLNASSNATLQNVTIARSTIARSAPSSLVSGSGSDVLSDTYRFFISTTEPTAGGTAITNVLTQAGISHAIPNYSMFRFQSTNPLRINSPVSSYTRLDDGQAQEFQVLAVTGHTGNLFPALHRYMSVGTDYSLYSFLCVPSWVKLPSWPTAAP